MPIYFWDLTQDTITLVFTIPFELANPATGEGFLPLCFTDGLAFDANDPTDPEDDELWFSDDVNRNIAVFKTNGTFSRGFDATTVDDSLGSTSGLAIGGPFVYLANNGGGDVFRANKADNPLSFVDQFTSGDTRQEDMECDPVTFSPREVMWIRTTPQGGQFPDVITAYEIEPGSCGFGGAPIDTDGDGLFDVWETHGYDFDGDGSIDVDLPAMGANPRRKDIFVEIDWMDALFHHHRPDPQAIQRIVEAFANAPVPNPDGSEGINLHVDFGEETLGSFSEGNALGHSNILGDIGPTGVYDWREFDEYKRVNFRPERHPIFHYAIFAHSIDQLCGPSGISRGISASDFIVALGGWARPFGRDHCEPIALLLTGNRDQEAGTFMHELGHNLGLHHGGNDSINRKPNYLSVMNYSFQTTGLIINGADGHFDYSHFANPLLDESSLSEPGGLAGGSIPLGYGTRKFNCNMADPDYVRVLDVNSPIDWNCNTIIDGGTVQTNVNGDSFPNPSIPIGGRFRNDEQLQPRHDWMTLIFNGGLIGLGAAAPELPTETPADELTPEEAAKNEPLQQMSGDLNSDGVVDCFDLGIVRASFGKRSGQPGFEPRADTNLDSIVDVRDLALVARQLPIGLTCP